MGLGLERDDTLDRLGAEPVACSLVGRGELLYYGTLCKRYIVLIGCKNNIGILFGSLLDHLAQ